VSADDGTKDSVAPWSLRPARLGLRAVMALGAGSVIASFYVGTGDVTVGTNMGAQFGYKLWWTYFVLGIAGWALIDMSVRYFLRFGRTPMSMFKEVHPIFTVYMFFAIIVCTTFGSYNQWAACAMVITGIFPGVPIEVGGAIAGLCALLFLVTGAYKRIERVFVIGLLGLIACFFGSALLAGIDWGAAVAQPFGIAPRSYMDLAVLLEPLAGTWSTKLFLAGLFLAAWTAGAGWWICGCYALLDIFNLPTKLDSKPMRICLVLFFIPSVALLLLRINPVYQMLVFSAFLAVVFPVVGLVVLWRVTRPDMGYFRWSWKTPRGAALICVDVFAVVLSAYIGWVRMGALVGVWLAR
jgi:Mn2+/Fe2+ NRAMP family transporter